MVRNHDEGEPSVCDYCQAQVTIGCLEVEVDRADGAPGNLAWDSRSLLFCNQDHAARYFDEGRLPAAEFLKPPTLPRNWKDRLYDASLYLILAPAIVLVAIGCWTVVQWILH